MSQQPFYLARQPILDRNGKLYAYELLFRASQQNGALISDDVAATSAVIHYAFSELGVQHVLGQHKGFINLSREMLLSDLVTLLPKEQVVLELLETIEVDDVIVIRCQELKKAGYTLAMDDVVSIGPRMKDVLPWIDIIKLDLLAMTEADLPKVVKQLKPLHVQLLAEKVDNQQQFEHCQKLGFHLYQGYYFAKPTMLQGKRANPSQVALLNLLGMVLGDAETEDIEQVFKRQPDLTLSLMRLVNSVGSGIGRRIESMHQAIVVLGRQQLKRWLQILIFSVSSTSDDQEPSPLMQLASTRGKQMELLAEQLRWSRNEQDQAFTVGMLSLLDALFQQPLQALLEPLNLSDAVTEALLQRTGRYGQLLDLVECSEQPERTPDLNPWSELTLDSLSHTQLTALDWVMQLSKTTGG
ncbi:EAL and HDOD domain-containing protein [Leeia sp.]|uniref:EAL and HDOD domain-containing protein n=1 Tax=Leeia sp. TaxID=2884678 RepID=UPI0035B0D188